MNDIVAKLTLRPCRLTLLLAGFIISASTSATPVTLDQVTGYADHSIFVDNEGFASARLTDTDGENDDTNALLLQEMSVSANANTFGIYSFTKDATGAVIVGESLEVFSGAQSPGSWAPTAATITFDLTNGIATNQATGLSAAISSWFGFYVETPANGGTTWYSHASLNQGGVDAVLMFDTSENSWLVGGADLILAFNVFDGHEDGKYFDLVTGLNDVVGVPTPPAGLQLLIALTMLLTATHMKRKFRLVGRENQLLSQQT